MLAAEQILQERYQLKQPLGRTAAGRKTWLAVDLNTQEKVIVKLLAFSPEMQWEEFKLFEREAQILQALNHPRIPHYRDYFSLDKEAGFGLPWFGLVQQYIPGSSFQELLEKGQRFTEKQVKKIASEILKILIYLHELSPPVLHRDIKPSNLIMGEDNHVYLVDFGAVQGQSNVTGVTFTVVGTSGYAPLEQFWGRAVSASDLYALGATLIHLLTGISPIDLPHADSRIKFTHLVSINPVFVSWIEKITETAVEKRFPTAREALIILKTGKTNKNHQSSLEVPAVRKISQPYRSLIKINKKSPEQLEIYIPPLIKRVKHKKSAEILVFSALSLMSGVSILSLVILSSGIIYSSIVFLILVILFWFKSQGLWEKTFIYFDRNPLINKFQIERRFLNIKFSNQDSLSNIYGVFLHNYDNSQDSYQVKIHSQSSIYTLIDRINTEESIWLAQEIQDWLHQR